MNRALGKHALYILPIALSLFLLTLSLSSLLLSSLSFETARRYADQFALDGSADYLTQELHQGLLWKLQIFAAFSALFSGVVWCTRALQRRLLARLLYITTVEIRLLLQETRNDIKTLDRAEVIGLATLLLLAAGIRLAFLNREIVYDEAFTFLTYASKPLIFGLSNYSEPNNHLLHTAMVRFASIIFGDSEWALRLPALFFGLLSLPLLYILARQLSSPSVALIGLGIYVGASPAVEYSTLSRGYSVVLFFFLLLTMLAHRLVRRIDASSQEHHGMLILLCVVSASGFYTIPTFLYPWLGILLWLSIQLYSRGIPLQRIAMVVMSIGLGSFILTLICYLPPLLISGPGALIANPHVAAKGWSFLVTEGPSSLVWTWENWHEPLSQPLGLLISGLALLGLLQDCRERRTGPINLLTALLAAALVMVLIQQVVPFRRMWLYLLPVYALYVGFGCEFVLRRGGLKPVSHYVVSVTAIAVAAVQCILLYTQSAGTFISDQGTLRDAKAIVSWLEPQLQAQDLILTIAPADAPMRYYFRRDNLSLDYLDPEAVKYPKRVFVVQNLEPNFTKGGEPVFESFAEIVQQNGHSRLTPALATTRKQFPRAIVYLFDSPPLEED